ncbi:hypothetical protein HU200_041213 [Digitaria exilis]|uniref:Uncharacterized protein n=1 Tax=Digitaria exilis TaxID=1010633 RepID=A0A835BGC6_9POAL|nr:hypothetical protein HU200_041213 [Digitaria exilis]
MMSCLMESLPGWIGSSYLLGRKLNFGCLRLQETLVAWSLVGSLTSLLACLCGLEEYWFNSQCLRRATILT